MGDAEELTQESLESQIEEEMSELTEDEVMAEAKKAIGQKIKNRFRTRSPLTAEQMSAYYQKRKDDPKYQEARRVYLKKRAERNKRLLALAKERFTKEEMQELGFSA